MDSGQKCLAARKRARRLNRVFWSPPVGRHRANADNVNRPYPLRPAPTTHSTATITTARLHRTVERTPANRVSINAVTAPTAAPRAPFGPRAAPAAAAPR